ncbi:MAG: PEP-CTERM sorting domain-containing protein [Pirellulaceae bacterium]|nr:PEP-CTERM sorting domain-containing protein [Pirellulaceae bacterium]
MLTETGALVLDINDTGPSSFILGDGTVNLDGTLLFDMSDVSAFGSWNVLAVGTLTETFGPGFTVRFAVEADTYAATETSSGVWTCEIASLGMAVFGEVTGVLSVVPEPGMLPLLAVGLLSLAVCRRRERG